MIRFCSLSSGSSGNCIFIGTETTRILIDAGISGKRIEDSLCAFGECGQNINALLITHEHCDHIQGAGIVSRRFHVPVYATKGTWDNMYLGKIDENNKKIIDPEKGSFNIGDIIVKPFRTPHDAAEPVAYTFFTNGHKLAVATDIGHITREICDNIEGSELVLLESNHDLNMLKYGSYPRDLRMRIAGDLGHLSNDNASEFASYLAEKGTKIIVLGHLSHENNTPTLAYDTLCSKLRDRGFENGKEVSVYVAKRDVPMKMICIED